MVVVGVLLTLLVAYSLYQAHFFLRRWRLQHMDWSDLVARVQPVNVDCIAEIADAFLHPAASQLRIQPDVMWRSVGEMEGLQTLHANADAMLDLALHASRWNSVEGRVVAEMIRRDGVRLKRALLRIEFAMLFGVGSASSPFQLQEAAAAYHLMRGRLLGLYKVAHVGLYPRLAKVL